MISWVDQLDHCLFPVGILDDVQPGKRFVPGEQPGHLRHDDLRLHIAQTKEALGEQLAVPHVQPEC